VSRVRRAVVNLRDVRPIWAIPPWAVAEIRAALDGWDVTAIEEAADGRGDGGDVSPAAIAAIPGAEIYLGFGMPRLLLQAALSHPRPALRWVHTGTAGVGSLLHPELAEAGITLTSSAGVHAEPMAETVLAMILHFARGIDFAVAAQQRGAWAPGAFEASPGQVREIGGATVGIIGMGGIGRAVAWRAAALGMRVLGVRRSARAAAADVEMLEGDDALGTLLERSDYAVVAVPSTAATRGLLDAAAIARLRPGAVLVNVARGDVVDEAALADALAHGRLRGAALDVFRQEPLPAGSPLWTLPNALVLPHVSGTSPRYWRRENDLILDNIGRYLRGEPLRNTVNFRRGY
jgi:phosphoglycerate dehydrogenase-like enzyme